MAQRHEERRRVERERVGVTRDERRAQLAEYTALELIALAETYEAAINDMSLAEIVETLLDAEGF